MTRILLTRHGDVEGLSPERFRGRKDVPLTKKGLAQAAALAKRIHRDWRPTAICTSPLQRCVVTADAIAAATVATRSTMNELIDFNYGAWEWLTLEEAHKAHPSFMGLWHYAPHLVRFPEGESLQDLFARTADALRYLLDHHHDETIVVVGHDSVNRAILLQALQQPPSAYWRIVQEPCALSEVEINRSHARVVRMNETAHLSAA